MKNSLFRSRKLTLSVGVCILSLAMFSSAQSAVIVSAGTLDGIGGSFISNEGSTLQGIYSYPNSTAQTDGIIHAVLNLGSIQSISEITIVNRLAATNLAARSLRILVAADESAPSFDPFSLSSYTQIVFANQLLLPSTNAEGALRTANITDSTKQYFLIDFTSNFFTGASGFSTTGNERNVQFSDIRVTAVPEPGTVALIGIASGFLLLRGLKKRRSNS